MSHDHHEQIEREILDADVVIVGAGCAGLSTAIHLQNLIARHNDQITNGESKAEPIPEQMIVVLEKGAEIGAHSFSGAVMDPIALRELLPDYRDLGCPIECEVTEDKVYYLSEDFSIRLPLTPPPFRNHGNYLISLAKFNRWLGAQAEARGINIFPGFPAVDVLLEGKKVKGVRTGDRGLDKHSQPKPNFEPGMIMQSKLTIFAEGTRGSLFRQLAERLALREGKNAEVFEEGVKEIIQMPAGTVVPGQVIHTLGFPLKHSVGGTFIYTLPDDKIVLGLVGYLDTVDPWFDPHRELQRLKTHPFLRRMLQGGRVIAYGGKTLPAGGWYSMPQLYADGMLVVGDSASMVDVKRLKGIHLAMKSGMLAAETAFAGICAQDFSEKVTKGYEQRVQQSFIRRDLFKTRNFHQALSQGLLLSLPELALQEVSGGRGFIERRPVEEDAKTTLPVVDVWGSRDREDEDQTLPKADGVLFFDKLSSVYLTGTRHDEDSPNHLILKHGDVCRDTCAPKYASPCNHFCPANVYEMVEDQENPPKKRLQINYTNCIHCKTCDIKCPFDNILWTPPEGGGGPQYTEC